MLRITSGSHVAAFGKLGGDRGALKLLLEMRDFGLLFVNGFYTLGVLLRSLKFVGLSEEK